MKKKAIAFGALNRRETLLTLAAAALYAASSRQAQAQGEGDMSLVDGYNALGAALYQSLQDQTGNIVFSPYSIGSALSMARQGARGDTETEMAAVLRQKMPREKASAANLALLNTLRSYDRTAQPDFCPSGSRWSGKRCEADLPENGRCPPPLYAEGKQCIGSPFGSAAQIMLANALMLTKNGGDVSDDYRNLLREDFDAEVFQDVALPQINKWVSDKTQGKVPSILDALDPMTAAILLNAVYFKAAWASPFSAAETAMKPFNLDPQKKIDVPTMQKRHNYQLAEGDGYRAINLPYAPQGLSMIIVLPDGIGKADEIAKAVDAEGATSLIGRLTRANETFVSLALPKFKTSFGAGLAGALQKEGMLKAFSQKDADFTGMTKDAPKPGLLYISDVLHRATIDVAEEGAEAAAATAVVFGLRSIMPVERPEPVPFIVDRPFLFYLVDDQTNAVLFRGRISNPLQ